MARFTGLLLIGVILSKTGFPQTDIGTYETLILITGLVSFFWINAVLNIYIQQFPKAEKKQSLVISTLFIILLFSIILVCVFLLLQNSISAIFGISKSLILLLGLLLIAQNISFFTEHFLLSTQKGKMLIWLSVAHSVTLPLTVYIIAATTGDIAMVVWGIIGFHTLKVIITVFHLGSTGFLHKGNLETGGILKLSAPLSISFLLGGASIYVDGIIINTQFDKATFAMYQYGAKEFPLAMILAGAVTLVMISKISGDKDSGIAQLKSGSRELMHKIFPVGIVLMLVSKYLFPLVFNPQFADSFIYFNIYLLLIIPRMLMPQAILTALEQTTFLMRISIIEFFLNIIISLCLLQLIGLPGVAFGTVAAYGFEKIAFIVRLRKSHIAFTDYAPANTFIFYSIVLVLTFIFATYSYL